MVVFLFPVLDVTRRLTRMRSGARGEGAGCARGRLSREKERVEKVKT
jgi:hypothetical protein